MADPAATVREFLRGELDRQRAEQVRHYLRETFPGASEGRALPAAPLARRARSGVDQAVSVVRGATVVHHVTLLSTFNQSIPDGGGDLTFEWWSEGPPNQRRGFTTLEAGGVPVGEIPFDITGVITNLELDGTWGEEQDSGDTIEAGRRFRNPGSVEIARIREGVQTSRAYAPGRIVSPRYTVQDTGWEIASGDRLKVTMPNASGEAQRHRQAELRLTIIELEATARTTVLWEKVATVDAWGIVQDGAGNWWVTGNAQNEVRKYSSAWVLQDTIAVTAARTRGITFDGTDLWVAADTTFGGPNTEAHFRYNTSGVLQQENEFPGQPVFDFGIGWDAGSIWAAADAVFQEIDRSDGSLLSSVPTPVTALRGGLDIHAGNFVVVHTAGDRILVVNSAGAIVREIACGTAVGGPSGPTGVWVDANGTPYISKDGDGVYRMIAGDPL